MAVGNQEETVINSFDKNNKDAKSEISLNQINEPTHTLSRSEQSFRTASKQQDENYSSTSGREEELLHSCSGNSASYFDDTDYLSSFSDDETTVATYEGIPFLNRLVDNFCCVNSEVDMMRCKISADREYRKGSLLQHTQIVGNASLQRSIRKNRFLQKFANDNQIIIPNEEVKKSESIGNGSAKSNGPIQRLRSFVKSAKSKDSKNGKKKEESTRERSRKKNKKNAKKKITKRQRGKSKKKHSKKKEQKDVKEDEKSLDVVVKDSDLSIVMDHQSVQLSDEGGTQIEAQHIEIEKKKTILEEEETADSSMNEERSWKKMARSFARARTISSISRKQVTTKTAEMPIESTKSY
mmetsp:Transcript_33333/g.37909  ORF Transcript_33333/g.37909 Transcript_33333/m.37909 type:complete len:353 (+) Transcript_33333:126-1184(+)